MSKTSSLAAIQIAACLGFLVVQLDVSVVNVGLGALKSAFDTNLTGLQWVINSYALAFSALLILGGAWGDTFGARTVFASGFAIFTIASIGCGLSNNMSMLIGMRIVQGVGAALLVPTSLTLIRLTFEDPDKRRSAVAMWGACGGIALAAGPVMGGLLIEYLGWRSVFWINVPIGILAIGLVMHYAPPSPRIERQVDVPGQISIAMCLASLTYGLTELSGQGWGIETFSAMGLAVLCAIAFVMIERRLKHPLLPKRLASNRVLATTALAGAAINLTFYGTVFVFSIYFQSFLHYDAFRTGIAFIPLTAVLTVSTMISSRIAKRVGATRIITAGFLIQVLGFLALSRVTPDSSLLYLNIALMVVGIGSAASVPSITNSMLSSVSRADAGMASGLMASARQLGGVVGVAVFGAMITSTEPAAFSHGLSRAMIVCALALLFCLAVSHWVTRSSRLPVAT
ncbi:MULTISPECIES: MFS transporter [Pseudomonas]|uniref:Major facilitator super family multidrug efflux pump, EmrB/QacA sub family n=1 Tax=Pseudomonas syringae pv. coryli TaxID=317659 RepID=A0A0P9N837_9PSED|nr:MULTISPECIES: MFS transporter [Pseudomonas]KPX01417.1 Major facilitator super family multidrug efflux pump, EmrB/QacA sub family [Pseudomonas syringae pv. coryli]KWS23028.1 MFS transporter [Pseudomonas syringae pv. syringae]MCA5973888.1 MFS transporter [Pseudomonas sp. P135]MCH5517078.1 MFS transporter [Pseudomonas syringae pv. syringae]MCH5535952.1 MFS transporter [Pseudomonas syringae pv. syringae]